MTKRLIVVTGPTGSGKTDLAISLVRELSTEIISADSRQIYAGIPICTAAPTERQLSAVKHHLVGVLPLDAYYSAAMFEEDALRLLADIWTRSDYAVVCGGSMMYIDALTYGIDDLPTISPEVRAKIAAIYSEQGIERIRELLAEADPEYYEKVDRNNVKRLVHALEIIEQSGRTYSSLRTGARKRRDFEVQRFHIDWSRDELFSRINRRVDAMIQQGLENEARSVYHLRHLNSLNTVGFKEMFAYFDGIMDRDTAIARMAKNTRVYAKKQLTWMKRRPDDFIALTPSDSFNQAMKIITE